MVSSISKGYKESNDSLFIVPTGSRIVSLKPTLVSPFADQDESISDARGVRFQSDRFATVFIL